jgi:hypothetical protein
MSRVIDVRVGVKSRKVSKVSKVSTLWQRRVE